MSAIRRFWSALTGLADALDRLAGVCHQAADLPALEAPTAAPALPDPDSQRPARSRKAGGQ